MPRRVVKRAWRGHAGTLGDERELDLVGGERGAFASSAERRAAWRANRDRILAAVNPGCRPAAWWEFEAKAARDPNRSQDEQLYVMGVLSDSEKADFEAWCKRAGRDLSTLPPIGFLARDPRLALLDDEQEGG
jgi:hypothetical protein